MMGSVYNTSHQLTKQHLLKQTQQVIKMARKREIQMEEYKAAKASGETAATSFKAWMEEQKAKRENDSQVIEQLATEHTQVAEVEEALNATTAALETIKQTATIVTDAAAVNKSKLAQAIFAEELAKGSARKVYIQRFMKEAGLTKNGAATYLQNIKKRHGLVRAKA